MTRLQDIENVILNLYLSDFIHQSIQHKKYSPYTFTSLLTKAAVTLALESCLLELNPLESLNTSPSKRAC
jgi:hypothetical protein